MNPVSRTRARGLHGRVLVWRYPGIDAGQKRTPSDDGARSFLCVSKFGGNKNEISFLREVLCCGDNEIVRLGGYHPGGRGERAREDARPVAIHRVSSLLSAGHDCSGPGWRSRRGLVNQKRSRQIAITIKISLTERFRDVVSVGADQGILAVEAREGEFAWLSRRS